MKYLSLDIEATGLDKDDLIIELACVPFSTDEKKIYEKIKFHYYIKCPSFEQLKPKLNPWVIENNETLIKKAHSQGLELGQFQKEFDKYLSSKKLLECLGDGKFILFGKSMNAIDLPFMTRDFGEEFMRKYFDHRYLDLSSIAYHLIDTGKLPPECQSGSELMKHFNMGEVAHTAYEDAVNTAKLYFEILELIKS